MEHNDTQEAEKFIQYALKFLSSMTQNNGKFVRMRVRRKGWNAIRLKLEKTDHNVVVTVEFNEYTPTLTWSFSPDFWAKMMNDEKS